MAKRTDSIENTYAEAINATVRDFKWSREDVIEEITRIDEVERGDIDETLYMFWHMFSVDAENLRDRKAYYGPAGDYGDDSDISWMEPGVAYTMGDEGFESWDNPYKNY